MKPTTEPALPFKPSMLNCTKLFMGNGKNSCADAYELLSALHEAIGNISSLEQFALQGGPHEDERETVDNMELRVRLNATKIYYALTGTIPTEVARYD
jgi:hypothetical protein